MTYIGERWTLIRGEIDAGESPVHHDQPSGGASDQERQVSRRHVVQTFEQPDTDPEPNPVVDVQPMKLASPVLT